LASTVDKAGFYYFSGNKRLFYCFFIFFNAYFEYYQAKLNFWYNICCYNVTALFTKLSQIDFELEKQNT